MKRRGVEQIMSKNGDNPFFPSLRLPDDVIVTGSFNTFNATVVVSKKQVSVDESSARLQHSLHV